MKHFHRPRGGLHMVWTPQDGLDTAWDAHVAQAIEQAKQMHPARAAMLGQHHTPEQFGPPPQPPQEPDQPPCPVIDIFTGRPVA